MPPPRSADITVHVEWLARRLTQQQEDEAAMQQHRVMVCNHRVLRVPSHLRLVNRDAYTPGLVALGPLHAGDSERRLRAGYHLKMAYLHSLISRGHPDPAVHLAVIEGYVRIVAAREREARATYAAEVDVDNICAEDFIQMMVLDGCFIIEHLVNVAFAIEEPSLHATPFGPTQLSVDLLLAENQLPFFILVDLIKNTRLPEFQFTAYDPPVLLMKLVLYYLAGEKGRDMSDVLPSAEDVSHILHLLHATITMARTRWQPPPTHDFWGIRMAWEAAFDLLRRFALLLLVPLLYLIIPEEQRWSSRYGSDDLPSATDMKRMWLRFKGMRTRRGMGISSVLGRAPLSVKVEEHEDCLRLPQLRIEYQTAPLLLNLMAFEQSSLEPGGPVSAYVWLMAKMVQSPDDAGVLLAAEVVRSRTVGSESKDDVLRFFRQVGAASEAATELRRSYLAESLEKLQKRIRQPLFMMWVDVQRYYVDIPWRLVAAFVTVVTIVASILQTVAAYSCKN